jgi:hypothetical protein
MSLFTEWKDLTNSQTDATIEDFWKRYCDTEIKLYSHILEHPNDKFEGNVGELIEQFAVEPVLFMGFLDGITTSLKNEMTEDDLEKIDESSDISLDIDLEKLYLNMLNADAPHLYGLEQWDELLSDEKKKELVKTHRRAGTVVKGEKIGRNDPCPCGSGKKYKHCCGRK